MWANVTTDASSARRADLVRDKRNALVGKTGKARGFFAYNSLPVEHITPADVANWQTHLEDADLSPASVYARVSRLSSFYDWLLTQPDFRAHLSHNPVLLARPKAPKAYQGESTQALSDEDVIALFRVVRQEAQQGDVSAIRDYAMLRFFFATGKRRAEIVSLKWGDLKVNGTIVFTAKHKGGLYRSTAIDDPGVKAALFDYLKASGRWDDAANTPRLDADSPLWLRHDRAAKGAQPVTSHGFAKAFKGYADKAGLGDVHLHQTRHTVAALVGEETGDMNAVQQILGHENIATTRVYLDRIQVKQDKHSRAIAKRLKLDED